MLSCTFRYLQTIAKETKKVTSNQSAVDSIFLLTTADLDNSIILISLFLVLIFLVNKVKDNESKSSKYKDH